MGLRRADFWCQMSCCLTSLQTIWADHGKLNCWIISELDSSYHGRVRSSEVAINCCSIKWQERYSIIGSRKDFCSCLHRKSQNSGISFAWFAFQTPVVSWHECVPSYIIWQNGWTCPTHLQTKFVSWNLSNIYTINEWSAIQFLRGHL